MTLSIDFRLKKKGIIKPGLHQFTIKDIDVHTTRSDDGVVQYLDFAVECDGKRYDRLLSAPLNTAGDFSDKSRLAAVLKAFGIEVPDESEIGSNELNGLIGSEFQAIVIFEDKFARIDERTIQRKW